MDTFTLITGVTSGIGLNLAVRLSGDRNLILVGRDEKKLDTVMKLVGIHHRALKLVCDLDADKRQVAAQLTSLIQKEGIQIEALVHCAGTSKVTPFRQADTDTIDTIFNVNVLSVMELIRPLLKKENKGALKNIVLVSSLASIRGEKGNAVYAASKGALNALAISLAKELAPKVRVNSISPGTVQTPMTKKFLESEAGAAHLETYPLGVGYPEDITNLTCFLLSDAAKWITGQNIVIDGGRSIY